MGEMEPSTSAKASLPAPARGPRAGCAAWLRRAGAGAILFFAAKGLMWVFLPALLAFLSQLR